MKPTSKDKMKFHNQSKTNGRKDAAGIPIEFRLTFEQWWDWWQATGHYHERGPKKGQYVMGRINDIGHYEIGNIVCITGAQNSRDARLGKPFFCHDDEWKRKQSEGKAGKPSPKKGVPQRRVKCPHCSHEYGSTGLHRHVATCPSRFNPITA
ncbi:hypothetical protein P0D69_28070 [Paraburkholderia sediminicola]|uniref:hypothetical protein n=1 Tax=Paraburkholderia sediminicola TaxID=458836 RepID=UPI0038BA71A3